MERPVALGMGRSGQLSVVVVFEQRGVVRLPRANLAVGEQGLSPPTVVAGDEGAGCGEDGRCGSIVLLELDHNRAREVARRMKQHQVLSAYADASFLIPVLNRLSQRLKRDNPLADGFTQFENNERELESDFTNFFPDVMAYARDAASDLDQGI